LLREALKFRIIPAVGGAKLVLVEKKEGGNLSGGSGRE
jgi:hypothetical protein